MSDVDKSSKTEEPEKEKEKLGVKVSLRKL